MKFHISVRISRENLQRIFVRRAAQAKRAGYGCGSFLAMIMEMLFSACIYGEKAKMASVRRKIMQEKAKQPNKTVDGMRKTGYNTNKRSHYQEGIRGKMAFWCILYLKKECDGCGKCKEGKNDAR